MVKISIKKAKIRESPRNKKKRTRGGRIDKDASPGQKNDEKSQGASKKRSASANTRKNKDITRHAMIRGLTRKEKQIMKGIRKNNSAGEAHRRNEARTIDTSNGQRTIYKTSSTTKQSKALQTASTFTGAISQK